ncbi:MAG: hypothetical protein IPJ06_10485 [Saprospiraceae bacterium]|nr:hypothetical protein [Saprospiraceae bacterium]
MNGICKGERMVRVEVSDPIILDLPPDTIICTNPILLGAQANRPVQIDWALDPLFQMIIGTGNPALLDIEGDRWIYVHAYDSTGCEVIDSIFIVNRSMEMELMDSLLVCPQEVLQLNAHFPDPLDVLSGIEWEPAGYFPGGNQTNPVFFEYFEPGEHTVYVSATNQHGCVNMDSLLVVVVDTSLGELAIVPTICSGYHVLFHLEAPGSWGYSWHLGDPANPGYSVTGTDVSYQYPGQGMYTVQAIIETVPGCTDTLTRVITLVDPPVVVDFDWEYITCADTAIVLFTSTSVNDSSAIIQLSWSVNGLPAGTGSELTWTVLSTDSIQIQLIASSANGCIDTFLSPVSLPVVELDLQNTVSICPGDSVQLNKNGSTSYTYSWTPASGLNDPTLASPWAAPEVTTVYSVNAAFYSPDTCALSKEIK